MQLSETDIQGLKAQEAKDLAVELLHKLQAKDKAPISPGEVQLKELQYELRLKEAEAEDNRAREEHERQIRELELQIEQERARAAETAARADRVRSEHAALLEQVRDSEESLSTQLERATREHNLKMEQLEARHAQREKALGEEIEKLELQKGELLEEIVTLTNLQDAAARVGELADEIEARQRSHQQKLQQMDEQFEAAAYEKTKRIKEVTREQELELANLQTAHKKQVMQEDRQAAEEILARLDMRAVAQQEWDRLQHAANETHHRDEQEVQSIRTTAQDELKRQYNITSSEVIDVTDLYYRHQATTREFETVRGQLDKVDGEIKRMRQHIEQEPSRIAAAVEAAKVHVQNTIESAGKR